MVKLCRCGHKKGSHEDGLDYGRNCYSCTVKKCYCEFFIPITVEIKSEQK